MTNLADHLSFFKRNNSSFRSTFRILIAFLIVRTVLGVWMWGVRQVFPAPLPPDPVLRPYRGMPPETNPWLEPWQRWDTPQYQAIAERGYIAFDTALFTPPLYPLLMYLAAPIFDGSTFLAGLVVSGITCWFCLLAIHRLASFELGEDTGAWRAAIYLISFPTAFFLSAAYTESLFLLAAILALLAARQGKWLLAGVWGAVAALTRSPGILIVVPLAYAAWQRNDRKSWLAVVITLAGASLFPLYVFFGLHLPPTAILSAVGRGGHLAIPGANLIEAVRRIFTGQLVEENVIELAFTLLFIVITIFIWKKLPRIYGVYAATLMALFLTRMGSPQPLVSMARYVLEIFPAFLVLAMWGRKPWVNRLILYLSWLGLLFLSAEFAIWGWVG